MAAAVDADPAICEAGGGGLLLPLDDHAWPSWLRATLYSVALVYCFYGVAIVADIFMASIEAITKRRRQTSLHSGKVVTSYVWNSTVANLSLMALGSSAPEIFLSLIDLVRRGLHVSEMGSATIVGSAAFNLLVIVAVCISVIPAGQTRLIEQYPVFIVTGIFSGSAYLWLAFILVVSSPDRIEIWEAMVTLLLLPVLILVSYYADIGRFTCGAVAIVGASTSTPSEEPELQQLAEEKDDQSRAADGPTVAFHYEDIPVDIGDEGAIIKPNPSKLKVRTVTDMQAQARHRGEDEASETGSKSSNGGILSGIRNIRRSIQGGLPAPFWESGVSSTTSKRRAPQMARGFSALSLASGEEEGLPRAVTRRKSIASYHHFQMKKPRKERGHDSGSETSDMPGDSGHDSLFPVSCSVQFLIDRQYFSAGPGGKPVTLIRQGATADLRIEYSIARCLKPLVSIDDVTLACALGSGAQREKSSEAASSCWADLTPTAHVALRSAFFPATCAEHTIACDIEPNADLCGDFIVTILDVKVESAEQAAAGIVPTIGPICSTYVLWEKRPNPGKLVFVNPLLTLPGLIDEIQSVKVVVCRQGGCSGSIRCAYATEALDAVPDFDYEPIEGILEFKEGQTEKHLSLKLKPKRKTASSRKLLLILKAPEDDGPENDDEPAGIDSLPATFIEDADGGEGSAILTVIVQEVPCSGPSGLKSLDRLLNFNSLRRGASDWVEQIVAAVFVNGSREEQGSASILDWLLHVLSLPWMLLFGLIPPNSFCGGWVCFIVCLMVIAGVTAIVADLTELFGCILKIPDIVTAITFVALGTSMPDLFASKVAATEDPTADASIVNVTGSNSVNVFLGLGLPWSIAAVYWALQERSEEWIAKYPELHVAYPGSHAIFAVPAANLGFSIIAFSVTSLGAISLLVIRRLALGAELGGGTKAKVMSSVALVAYWIGYVAVVSWRALRYDGSSMIEDLLVIGGIFALAVCISVAPLCLIRAEGRALADAASAVSDGNATADDARQLSAAPGAAALSSSEKTSVGNEDLWNAAKVQDHSLSLTFTPPASPTLSAASSEGCGAGGRCAGPLQGAAIPVEPVAMKPIHAPLASMGGRNITQPGIC